MAEAVSKTDRGSIWWVFFLEGIASLIFGGLLLAWPGQTLVAFVIFLGFYWLFIGVLELVRVFVDKSVPWFWSLIIGVVGIVAGIIVLNHPLFAAIVLPAAVVIWLGVLGIIIGVFAVIASFAGGGVGSFVFGIINFIIGLILLSSPMTAAIAVPLVFGILLLIQGVVLIVWSLRIKS